MPNNVKVAVSAPGAKQATSEVDAMRNKFRQFSNELRDQGTKGGLAFGAAAGAAAKGVDLIGNAAYSAGRAVGDFVHDSIEAASHLNETMSKSDVVFGSTAASVSKWGDTSAKAFGMSKQAAVEAAASFGNVFKGLGFANEKSAEMSEGLVQLAGDLASFNDLEPTEALDKLKSGLAGEAEPLRSVGVFLNEATVKAKAMQMGLGNAHGELTEGEKILARYQVILDQTKTAQGDFARTADGLANSQRTANGEMANASAALGEKLLPVQLAVTKAQIDAVDALGFLADGIAGKLSPAILAVAVNGGKMAEATKRARDQIMSLDDETLAAAVQFGVLTQSEVNAANGAKYMSSHVKDDLIDVERSGREMGTAAGEGLKKIGIGAIWSQEAVDKAFRRIKNASHTLKRDLLGDASKLVDDYFDVLIAHDELSANSAEMTELRRKVAAGKATKEEIRQLHRLEQTQVQLLDDLASHGKTSDKEYEKAVKGLLARLKHAHGEERREIEAEIRKLQLLAIQAHIAEQAVGATIAKGGYVSAAGAAAANHHAAGGRYMAGQPRIVGELGPELDIPDHSGTIIPNNQLRSGASSGSGALGGITIQLGTTIVGMPSPGQIQQWARDAAPALARELQRQRLL